MQARSIRKLRIWLLALPLCLSASTVLAWETVGNGIEYQQFTASGPNKVYVARMSRSNTDATIETCLGQGKINGGLETVSGQASRYDDEINYWGQIWGQRNDVVAAVNGDYWNADGSPYGGQVQSGWYAKRFNNWTGDSGFGWSLYRTAFIGDCVRHVNEDQFVKYVATGNTQKFKGINVARGADQLIIYTHHFDRDTKTDNTGVEVLVELTRPMVILPSPEKVTGYVREIRQNQGSTPIPFDHVVLSAVGTAAPTLLNNVSIGAEIGISQKITNCAGLTIDWTETYASVGGNYVFLRSGVIFDGGTDPGLTNRDPRTAVAYDNNYIYFVVVDGRQPGVSEGMTMTELGNFCKNTLGATHGINNDGGGSSTMVVNGVVKNNPSDGSPRSVSNGIMMVNVMPKVQSTFFSAGQTVRTTASTNVRLGPGTNFAILTTVTNHTQGTILSHSMKGLYAKGYYWWKVDFSGTVGWVAESLLEEVPSPPTITQQPQPEDVCTGGTAIFTVGATGSGTLTYQWQKNLANLSNGGHYSGVTTPILTISDADSSDAAAYRCMVTNPYGTATSDEAALTVRPPVTVSISPPSVPMTTVGPVTYTVTYANADTVTLSEANVTLNSTGTAGGTVFVSGSGNITRTVTISSISGDGTLGISIAAGTATGCNSAPAAGPSSTFLADNTPPSAVTVTDEGTWTPSQTTLTASWTASSDGSGSGIDRYEYAIGTAPRTQDIKGWTSVESATSMSDSSLTLTDGQKYYIQARAVDNVALEGAGSAADGITVAPLVNPISSAWPLADSVGLSIRNKVVTAALGGAFWLEEENRSAAMKVVSSAATAPGHIVSVAGVLGMAGSQRALVGDVVEDLDTDDVPPPIGMNQRELGGAGFNPATPGVTGGKSLYNIGLLVRCWGTVTYSDTSDRDDKYFYFDDGSGLSSGGHDGVLVRCRSIAPPSSGMAIVTGVAASESIGGKVVPVILIRDSSDIIEP